MTGVFRKVQPSADACASLRSHEAGKGKNMGKVYVVGIGPGSYEDMTLRAAKALEKSDVIVGYTVYVGLVKEHFPGKEFLTTGMRQEEERCRLAFEEASGQKRCHDGPGESGDAKEGRTVAMICSGDAGVYGLASLMLTVGQEYPDVEVEVIPGVTAALSGASVLGAPLTHDFCLISLSDLMTPLEVIEKRVTAAAEADFAMVIYNPSSRKRADYLKRACRIILRYRSPETVCGYVKNIGREGEEQRILTLGELKETQTDMFTTVFIGNSHTTASGGQMITPRGYAAEKGQKE